MKPPEEIKVDGGRLVVAKHFVNNPGTQYITYEIFPDAPMPELKAGYWIQDDDALGDKTRKHLVVNVCPKMDVVDYYDCENENVQDTYTRYITAVYDELQKEIWRR